MKKNAFTLIELLATLIIIGLIATITIPKLNNTINDARINTNKVSVNSLSRTATNYYIEQKTKNKAFQSCIYDFTTNTNTCTGLEFTGKKPESGKISIKKTGEVALAVQFNKKCFLKSYYSDNIEIIDYNEETCGANEHIFTNYDIPEVVTTGSGLYKSTTDEGRHIYRGENPNNYILLKENSIDTYYRIISFENDGTIKVIRNDKLSTDIAWDAVNTRNSSTDTYCQDASTIGCNVWGNQNNTLYNGTSLGNNFHYNYYLDNEANNLTSGLSGKVTLDSSLNTYLNGTWLTDTGLTKYIENHDFNVGGIYYTYTYTSKDKGFAKEKTEQNSYTWNGKVGLISLLEFVESSTNANCTSLYSNYYHAIDSEGNYIRDNLPNETWPCGVENYNYKTDYHQWTLTPNSNYQGKIWIINSSGTFGNHDAGNTYGVRPVFYIKPSIKLSGTGSQEDPYIITNM